MQQDPRTEQTPPELTLQPESPEAPSAEATAEQPPISPDVVPSLQEALRQAELKASEHHDAWLRAKAETDNIRRRAQEDVAKAAKFAAEKFAQSMLPVKDSLEAALATDNATLETLRQGVELTLKQLVSAFNAAGVSEESPDGKKFDPNRHQAISAVEAAGEPNTVITVLQKGYLLNERVIRPALVVVSKAKNNADA
jgi:molecular chaperone GrpE